MQKKKIAAFSELEDRKPSHALVANVDLVLVKYDDEISVMYGRCLHRGAIEPQQFAEFAEEVREETEGIPIGCKLSAQHIEKDSDAALAVGVDYIILDERGGGTWAAPSLFRDNISVPTIPALAQARGHHRLSEFNIDDLCTWKEEITKLSGISFSGVSFDDMGREWNGRC
ncbi:glutamate synthase-related protein [Pseudovibrio exalbescens]|uniref:glutamate synthase-related protein n=1 Tax=Pseudovibrio exalbescens TaxID=197461 RepID=UPI002365CEE5|nr:glutamate synthase-related protein [Pseudovibrio exalbescens]MDD7910122.1 glutamate synthase-related protein [Pseudovibrio exalbescens]